VQLARFNENDPQAPWHDLGHWATGSGKTTTPAYGALQKINDPGQRKLLRSKIGRVPVRRVNQINVKPQIGLTFANGLR